MLRGKAPGNPADMPGVIVYQPEYDPSFEYVPGTNQVLDGKSGEKFWIKSPHNEGIGSFGVTLNDREQLVMGRYYVHFIDIEKTPNTRVYDIAHIDKTFPGRTEVYNENYDVARLAQLFVSLAHRGRSDLHGNEVVVVDSRPIRSSN